MTPAGSVVNASEALKGWSPSSISRGECVVDAVFEAYTPYLGGDFKTRTFEILEPLKTQGATSFRLYFSGRPTAKSVLGRMRWLARIAVGNAAGSRNFREAELVASPTLGEPLIPLLFGYTEAILGKGGHYKAWKGLLSLALEFQGPTPQEPHKAFTKGKTLRANRYNALLARGTKKRSKEEVRLLAPAPSGFKVRFKLIMDSRRLRLLAESRKVTLGKEFIENLKTFSASLLVATLAVFGIGKGANRGFGRFRLAHSTSKICMPSQVANIARTLPHLRNAGEAESAIRELLILITSEAARLIGGGKPASVGGVLPNLTFNKDSKRRSLIVVEARRPFLPKPCKKVVGHLQTLHGVERAIEAIGIASTKTAWKICVLKKSFGEQGLNVHTWPLGLPRSQKFPGKKIGNQTIACRCKDDKRKTVNEINLLTGYMLGAAERDVFIVYEDDCEPPEVNKENGGDIDISVLKWSDAKLSEGRRQSSIIAFPLPSGAPDPLIAVIFLPSNDLKLILDNYKGLSLYHLGPHNPGDPDKHCSEPGIKVSKALSNPNLAEIIGKKGGALHPSRLSETECKDDLALCAFWFFVEALRAIY